MPYVRTDISNPDIERICADPVTHEIELKHGPGILVTLSALSLSKRECAVGFQWNGVIRDQLVLRHSRSLGFVQVLRDGKWPEQPGRRYR